MKIAIIDYGMGNIYSLKAAIKKIEPEAEIYYTNDADEIRACDRIFLPGVGNFTVAMEKIRGLHLHQILDEVVKKDKKPIMGICLGMQLLFERGVEGGDTEGLGFIKGTVNKFSDKLPVKIPHMGFNEVKVEGQTSIFQNVNYFDFYFVHSFRVKSLEQTVDSYGECNYGESFIATVEYDNIVGTQFHPEKSQGSGLRLLENFLKQTPKDSLAPATTLEKSNA
ncbi:MAG: imidazole glycerol phosphate synthase subunit HisH [Bacteroidota bacterium]